MNTDGRISIRNGAVVLLCALFLTSLAAPSALRANPILYFTFQPISFTGGPVSGVLIWDGVTKDAPLAGSYLQIGAAHFDISLSPFVVAEPNGIGSVYVTGQGAVLSLQANQQLSLGAQFIGDPPTSRGSGSWMLEVPDVSWSFPLLAISISGLAAWRRFLNFKVSRPLSFEHPLEGNKSV